MNNATVTAALIIGTIAGGLVLPSVTHGQATLHDPVPVGDTQAISITRTMSLNSALDGSGPSDAELARRKSHGAQHSECRQRAATRFPAGSAGRREARAECLTAFRARKETWYDPEHQLP